ncbi:MAG: glycosyltransferase family 4 protein [Mariprofundaceae bacterium]
MAGLKHVLWVNDHGALVGGCERYIHETTCLLRQHGIRSSLLYQLDGQLDATFINIFDGAYPMVDPARQIDEISPDVVYVHRLSGVETTRKLAACKPPVVRFFHDHKLFCLREHKYTTLGHHNCTQPIGPACYTCLGFVNRSDQWPGVRLASVGALTRELRANMRFDAFVVGSSYMGQHVAAHGFDPARVHTLPLFAFPAERDHHIERESDLLIFVGQLIRGKGVDLLLDAMVNIKTRARLIIIGSGRQEHEYREQVKQLGLDERVSFTGKLSPAEINAYFQRAACLVFPSRTSETFGLVGPEAMRFGTPAIATTVGGITEWLDHGHTGIGVPSGDSGALANAIDTLLSDAQLMQNMQTAALNRYEKHFRPETHIDKLIGVFENLSAPSGRGRRYGT